MNGPLAAEWKKTACIICSLNETADAEIRRHLDRASALIDRL